MPTIGLDTGFFKKLIDEHPKALAEWTQIEEQTQQAVLSCLTLFEWERLGLRGIVSKEAADVLLEHIPVICQVVWIESSELLHQSVRIAHGNGLSMADAIIFTSLMETGADPIYTTDPDFESYEGGPEIVLL